MPSLDSVPGAGMLVNDDGIIIDWNDRCRAIFGDGLEGNGGGHLETLHEDGLVSEPSLERWLDTLKRATHQQSEAACQLTLHTGADGQQEYELVAEPIKNDLGRVVCTLRSVGTSQQYAETLTTLHAATRDLMTAETTTEVFERTAIAADEVLGFPGTGVRE